MPAASAVEASGESRQDEPQARQHERHATRDEGRGRPIGEDETGDEIGVEARPAINGSMAMVSSLDAKSTKRREALPRPTCR
jgi:hypothetical protein